MTTASGAGSITQEHVLACVASELASRRATGTVRLLDVGCGEGGLIAFLSRRLPELVPGISVEIHGFDVRDHGVQAEGFMSRTMSSLRAAFPEVDWSARISSIAQADPWPYPDGLFDVVVSNQVMEHVADHDLAFGEMRRVLVEGGFAFHLFPLKHYVWEGHLLLPFVHRITHFELQRSYIRFLSRLGLGKFRDHQREFGATLDTFSERHADYMLHYTNYLSYRELLLVAKRHGLRPSFRFTKEFYGLKLRSMLGRPPRTRYVRQGAFAEWLACMALRYVSSITVFLEKRETYRAS